MGRATSREPRAAKGNLEIRDQKTEGKGLGDAGSGQLAAGRSQRSEDRGQRSETGKNRSRSLIG